jgi:NADH dehydrogenase
VSTASEITKGRVTEPQPVLAQPRVLIVGAGFGGLNAAWALRRARVQVTIIDRRNHHLFQPLLYQVATAGLSPANIAYPIRSIVRRNLNTRVLLEEVHAIDLDGRRVTTTQGDIKYDFLILAAGADNFYFGHDEWARHAPGLKSLEDAINIRRRILLAFEMAERERDDVTRRMLLTFVVVGGGPTGVELAGAIAEISRQVIVSDFRFIDPREARIVLIEAGPRILPTFDEALAARAVAALRNRGVEVVTASAAKAISADLIRLDRSEIRARTIIWAAGVAASPLARTMGVELDRAGRVKVRSDLSIEGHPEAFVIGDLAACVDAAGRTMPGLAPVAIQQGRCAASNIVKALAGRHYEQFKYVDKGALATVGRAFAILQLGRVKLSGLFAWLIWSLVHVAYLIGFRNRVIVMFEWAWAYITYQRGARLITGDIEELTAPPHERREPDAEITHCESGP